MRASWRIGRACAIVAAALALSAPPARAAETGLSSDLAWGLSAEAFERTARALQELGPRWVRLDANWWWLDDDPKVAWADLDRAVEFAVAAGMKIEMVVTNSPYWASGTTNHRSPPRDPADYGRFMREIATRYKGKVAAYELWNEPNIPRFWPSGPDAARYVPLLRAGSEAVRQADPAAKVLFAGLAGNDYAYLEAAYAADPHLGDHFDAMALHPYTAAGAAPDAVFRLADGRLHPNAFTGYREVREVLLDHGDRKPIWLTEFGWSSTTEPTFLGGVDEQAQADHLERAYRQLEDDPYVEVAIWYTLRNNWWSLDANTWEDRLGLMTSDHEPKPAYRAFARYAAEQTPAAAAIRSPAVADVVEPVLSTPAHQPSTAHQPGVDVTLAPDPEQALPEPAVRPLVDEPSLKAVVIASSGGGRRLAVIGRIGPNRLGRLHVRMTRLRSGRPARRLVARSVRTGRRGSFRTVVRITGRARWHVRAQVSAGQGSVRLAWRGVVPGSRP